jgi:hypothetical protein
VIGGRRKQHNEELHNLCSSQSIIRMIKSRRMRLAGHIARMGAKKNVYRLLVGKLEGMRPLERSRCRWVDTNKLNVGEMGEDCVDWSGSGWGQEENSCEYGDKPSGSITFWEILKWLHNSNSAQLHRAS